MKKPMKAKAVESNKKYIKVKSAKVCIRTTLTNTIVSITDTNGNVIKQFSAAMLGYSNKKKSSPFAIRQVFEKIEDFMKTECGIENVDVQVRGINFPKEAIAMINGKNAYNINTLSFDPLVAHGGTRKRRPRRV